jgi:NlpC/P60 family
MTCQLVQISVDQGREILEAGLTLKDLYTYDPVGDGSNGTIDCSHFVYEAIKKSGVLNSLPDNCDFPYQNTYLLKQDAPKYFVEVTTPQLGDLVLFSRHVGIYAGAPFPQLGFDYQAVGSFLGAQGGGINFEDYTNSSYVPPGSGVRSHIPTFRDSLKDPNGICAI